MAASIGGAVARRLRLSPLMALQLGALSLLALFAGVFALRAVLGMGEAGGERAAAWRPPAYAGGAPEPLKPESAYAQTLRRPIFFKSRRPYAAAAKPAAAPAAKAEEPPPSGLTVSAIVKLGRKRRAFVVSSGKPEGDWYGKGDRIDDWTIADIKPFEVILSNGDRSAPLKLAFDAPPVPPAGGAVQDATVPAPPAPEQPPAPPVEPPPPDPAAQAPPPDAAPQPAPDADGPARRRQEKDG